MAGAPNVIETPSFDSIFEVISFTTALQADIGWALRDLLKGRNYTGRSLYTIALVRSGIDRPRQLADFFDVLPSTITFELNKLVAEGLLLRERVPGDGRSLRLSLTDRGETLHREMYRIIDAFMRERTADLGPGELETFLSIGRKLTRNDKPRAVQAGADGDYR